MLKDRVKKYRLANKLNKAQLARKIEVSDVTINYWESGKITSITSDNLIRLAAVFGITVSELVDDPHLPAYRTTIAQDAAAAVRGDLSGGNTGVSVASEAAIAFALNIEKGLDFLRAWEAGDFAVIRENWPDAPEAVFQFPAESLVS